MFQDKTTREFRCEYCPKSFSKRSSYRNHLRSHRDQMYLDETGLSLEETATTSTRELDNSEEYRLFVESLNNEQAIMLEDYHRQEKVYKVRF